MYEILKLEGETIRETKDEEMVDKLGRANLSTKMLAPIEAWPHIAGVDPTKIKEFFTFWTAD